MIEEIKEIIEIVKEIGIENVDEIKIKIGKEEEETEEETETTEETNTEIEEVEKIKSDIWNEVCDFSDFMLEINSKRLFNLIFEEKDISAEILEELDETIKLFVINIAKIVNPEMAEALKETLKKEMSKNE